MKKFYLTLIIVFSLFQLANAQWTTSGNDIYNSNTGNVGIGTTNPASNLEIKGSTVFDASTIFRITNNTGDYGRSNLIITGRIENGNDLWFFGSGARNSIVFAENAAASGVNIGAIGDEKFSIQLEGNSNSMGFLSKQNGNTPNMIINQSGSVGIGTTNPNAGNKLEVNGSVATSPSGGFWLNTARSAGIADQGNGGSGDGGIYFRTGNSDGRMVISASGNVLIGKTTQTNVSYILDVAGNIRSNQIVVNTNGADFVFNPSYRLNSLSNLKKYIDRNHHLPEIPSAKQMQAMGLDVGDTQVKLLQKVEELTLYTIASDKEIKDEKALIRQQQVRLSAQQAQIDLLIKQVSKLSKVIAQ